MTDTELAKWELIAKAFCTQILQNNPFGDFNGSDLQDAGEYALEKELYSLPEKQWMIHQSEGFKLLRKARDGKAAV
jgi:hypothetical protein